MDNTAAEPQRCNLSALMAARSSSVPSLPPPRPKSPPEYPDLYGRRREAAKLQMLDREISFLEEELRTVDSLQAASRCCKELTDFVIATSDPFIPTTQKTRNSCRFWKWLCGVFRSNFSWVCCCCYTLCPPEMPCCCKPCSCNPCGGSCKSCSSSCNPCGGLCKSCSCNPCGGLCKSCCSCNPCGGLCKSCCSCNPCGGLCKSCCSCNPCGWSCKSCFSCSIPKSSCCSCPSLNCCTCKEIMSCCCCWYSIVSVPSCSCSCSCSFPGKGCCKWKCSWPKIKCWSCFKCKDMCCSCNCNCSSCNPCCYLCS